MPESGKFVNSVLFKAKKIKINIHIYFNKYKITGGPIEIEKELSIIIMVIAKVTIRVEYFTFKYFYKFWYMKQYLF